jgi:hypothetical protein
VLRRAAGLIVAAGEAQPGRQQPLLVLVGGPVHGPLDVKVVIRRAQDAAGIGEPVDVGAGREQAVLRRRDPELSNLVTGSCAGGLCGLGDGRLERRGLLGDGEQWPESAHDVARVSRGDLDP